MEIGETEKEDEWLQFVVKENKPKTVVFSVRSKCSQIELGEVKWYPAWRHYCFFPTTEMETVHSDRCLISIGEFIEGLNERHEEGSKNGDM
jgi:hypothetical protein